MIEAKELTTQNAAGSEQLARKKPRMKKFYRKYIRPWIRSLVLVTIVLVIFNVSANTTTYISRVTPQFRPAAGDGKRPAGVTLKLPDLMLDSLPDFTHKSGFVWDTLFLICDFTPAAAVVMMLLALVIWHDFKLIVQVLWIESIMMFFKAVCQLVTVLPDSRGYQEPCVDPNLGRFGPWIVLRVSPYFCGDMIWSGHTFHLLLALVVLYRLLCAWLDTLPQEQQVLGRCSPFALKASWIVLSVVWMIFLLAGMLLLRQHYTVDLVLALFVTTLLVTNDRIINLGTDLLYVPYVPTPQAVKRFQQQQQQQRQRQSHANNNDLNPQDEDCWSEDSEEGVIPLPCKPDRPLQPPLVIVLADSTANNINSEKASI